MLAPDYTINNNIFTFNDIGFLVSRARPSHSRGSLAGQPTSFSIGTRPILKAIGAAEGSGLARETTPGVRGSGAGAKSEAEEVPRAKPDYPAAALNGIGYQNAHPVLATGYTTRYCQNDGISYILQPSSYLQWKKK